MELEFLESGGYRNSVRLQWHPQFIFEDSQICLNRDPTVRETSCQECALAEYVPADRRSKRTPCRFIPLSQDGLTLDFLYRTGTAEEWETAVAVWLRQAIKRLEEEIE